MLAVCAISADWRIGPMVARSVVTTEEEEGG